MKTEADFKNYYDQVLTPDLRELEIKRLRLANRARTLIIFELVVYIAIIIYALFLRPEQGISGTTIPAVSVSGEKAVSGEGREVILLLAIVENCI